MDDDNDSGESAPAGSTYYLGYQDNSVRLPFSIFNFDPGCLLPFVIKSALFNSSGDNDAVAACLSGFQ